MFNFLKSIGHTLNGFQFGFRTDLRVGFLTGLRVGFLTGLRVGFRVGFCGVFLLRCWYGAVHI